MIDLHSHILPGIDDGAQDEAQSLEMARVAVAEGVQVLACTPHIYPGVYPNRGQDIMLRVEQLQARLDASGIPLRLVAGADVHVAPNLVETIRSGEALTLNNSRYILIEPPHHVLPPRIEEMFFSLLSAGYVPILTHPERMTWIEQRYDLIRQFSRAGVWMQLTGPAIVGQFGSRAVYWSERMLDEGLVQIVASDAHDPVRRPPLWRACYSALGALVGNAEALALVYTRPLGILNDEAPASLWCGAPGPDLGEEAPTLMGRLMGLFRS